MNVQFESDWRSQLDSKYADTAYNGLLPNAGGEKLGRSLSATFGSNFDDFDLENTKSKMFDSIRFPPCAKVNLPGTIDREEYRDTPEPYAPKNGSILSNDSMAGLDFLEALFQTVVEKAVDVRDSIIENGSYVYSLGNPPAEDEAEYMRSVLIENLTLLRDESLQLIKEMVIFQTDKVNDMIHPDIKTAKDIVMRRKTSLFRRTAQMKHEITESAIVVDSLIHYSNSIISFPTTAVCKIDGIHVDWTKLAKMQQKVSSSNRSVSFSSYMISKGFTVCGVIYKFLQSTKSYGNIIELCNYYFQPGELKTIFDFFHEQHEKMVATRSVAGAKKHRLSILESIHQLILFNCSISDKDCHMISTHLHLMKNLHTLSLKTNRITYSGISSFATAVFEVGSLLKCLRLDDNNINTDGAHVLAQSLHRLPYLEVLSVSGNPIGDKGLYYLLKNCMNRYRRAFKELPQPTKRIPHSYASMLGSSEGSYNGLESVQDDDQALHLVDDVSVNDADEMHRKEKSRNMSRKYFHCYFDDYFALPLTEAEVAKINNDKMRERFDSDIDLESRWINHQDDEFYMEQISNYSDEVITPEEQAIIDAAAAKRAAIAKAEVLSKEEQILLYPRLIQALLRVRVKLVAVNVFLRFMRKGSMVSSLNVGNCGLTSGVTHTIVHALSDDRNITSLDLSGNTQLLTNNESCTEISKLFEKSALTTIKLNKCSVNDYGVMQLMKSAMQSKEVHTIELSDNYVGPTGANWIATAAKVFYVDTLELKSGFHKNVPFANVNLNPATHIGPDHQFFDDYDNEDIRCASSRGSGTYDDEDEDEPYEDTDLYTGDDDDYEGTGSSYYDDDDDDDEEYEGGELDGDNDDDDEEATRQSEIRRPEDEEEEEEDEEVVSKRFNVL